MAFHLTWIDPPNRSCFSVPPVVPTTGPSLPVSRPCASLPQFYSHTRRALLFIRTPNPLSHFLNPPPCPAAPPSCHRHLPTRVSHPLSRIFALRGLNPAFISRTPSSTPLAPTLPFQPLLTSRVSVIFLCPLPTKFPLFYFHSSICYHSRPPPLSPVRARPESRSFATLYIGYVNSSASASVLPSQLLRLLLSLLLRREPRP